METGLIMHPKIGIVVITYNRLDCLKQCVRGIREHSTLPYRLLIASDGSTDGTHEWLAEQTDLAYIAAPIRRGCGWNRNRGVYALATKTDCHSFIHLEDDTVPCESGWDSRWVDAVPNRGFIAYAFPGGVVGGSDTPRDPLLSNSVGLQCASFDRNLLNATGYSDPLFFGPYGHEDTEWRWRFYRAFGGRRVPVGGLGLNRGVRVIQTPSGVDHLSSSLNGLIINHIADLPMPRLPWRSYEQQKTFLAEQKTLVAPAGWWL